MGKCFVVFMCLEASHKKEELELEAERTWFVRVIGQVLYGFVDRQQGEVTLIIPDHQPRMSWGWQTDQAEITGLCKLMGDDMVDLFEGWKITLWSELIAGQETDFASAFERAKADPRALVLAKEYGQKSGSRRVVPRELALAKVAQYAAEGFVLPQVFPAATLLQSELNAAEVKEKMYRLLGPTLPILSPFRR